MADAQATLPAPIPGPVEDNYKVAEIHIRGNQGSDTPRVIVVVSVQDPSGIEIRRFDVYVPQTPDNPSSNVIGFLQAMASPRAGEVAPLPRKLNFRVLGYLYDTGYFPGLNLVA